MLCALEFGNVGVERERHRRRQRPSEIFGKAALHAENHLFDFEHLGVCVPEHGAQGREVVLDRYRQLRRQLALLHAVARRDHLIAQRGNTDAGKQLLRQLRVHQPRRNDPAHDLFEFVLFGHRTLRHALDRALILALQGT